ncbi:hypothetical protein [Photobacterium satsumensis]|uniref:hypothetical protein n=1 Tax=Photobacterium satsumensis TaxID=2910239 RepID=UPI003D106D24
MVNKIVERIGGIEKINYYKERDIIVTNKYAEKSTDISLGFVRLKVPYTINEYYYDESSIYKGHLYSFESVTGFISIAIDDKSMAPSFADSFKDYDLNHSNLNELIDDHILRSDFELTKYFFNVSPSDLSLFYSLDEIEIITTSLVYRLFFSPFDGNLIELKLSNGYQVLQFGEPDMNNRVRVNIYGGGKLLINIDFDSFSQQDIDFVISTLEVKAQTNL